MSNIFETLKREFEKRLKRQASGSAVCLFCNELISVNNEICPLCKKKNPCLWGYSKTLRRMGSDLGFLSIVIWGCIFFYVLSLLIDPRGISFNTNNFMSILSPGNKSLFWLGSTGAIPVFELGRWWTVISSAWLHGGLFHIAFNLVWLKELIPVVSQSYGAGRSIIIYLISSICGGLLTSLLGTSFSIGASGALFGLFGALVAYGQIMKYPHIKQKYLIYAVIGFVLGLIMPGIDNWSHLSGFLGGYSICFLPPLNPKKREGYEYLLIGLGCIMVMVLSVLASIIHGWQFLPYI